MLREGGRLARGAVTGVEVRRRLQTTVSHLCFARLTYDDEASGLPNDVLMKWPLAGGAAADQGLSEPAFYKQIAPDLGSPPIVRCIASAPPSSETQWLILEDLRSTHTSPPWPDPPSRSEAEGAVTALAHVHARWWEAPTLGSSVGALHTDASLREMIRGITDKLPGFLETLGDTLSRQDRRLLAGVFSSSLAPWLRLTDPRALTVIHGDAHTLNILFPRSGAGLPYLIDWQLWHLDVGTRDLAFMMALHWHPHLRQELERPLLRLYYDRLGEAGISGYSFDDLWLDYRRCAVRNLTFPIILWGRGQAVGTWRQRLDCALAAYRDLDGDELL
jgi:hypothetical protein